MKWKLSLLFAIVVGALAGSWIKNLPGFVIVALDKTSYEMRLWIAICFILLIFASLVLLLMLVRTLLSSFGKVKSWHGGLSWRRSRKKTVSGMLLFTEGRWRESEEAMVKAAKSSDTKLINYLVAAQAAQHQQAETRRDSYLRLAHQSEPAAKTAIGLTQAQLQLKQGQFEQALASLTELRAQNPNHPYVLKLLCRLFEQLHDWQELQRLMPALKKYQVFNQQELDRFGHVCVAGLLDAQAAKGEVESLRDCWLKLSSAQRKSKTNAIHYAKLLVDFDYMEEAENILKPFIKKQPDAEVLALYGNLQTRKPEKQLSFLESWHKAHPKVPREVYLTLGKVAFQAELWGKAHQFIERALQLKPSAEAYLLMAKTLQKLGDEELANNCFEQGLIFAATPKKQIEKILLAEGSEDLVNANILPKFEKLEQED